MKEKLTPIEMFKKLDDDGTGLISKTELVEALIKLKFKVTMADMEDIWPMLNADGGMQITAKEWDTFIEGASSFCFCPVLARSPLTRSPRRLHLCLFICSSIPFDYHRSAG